MGHGLWVMGYGFRVMNYGSWVMGYGLWVMARLSRYRSEVGHTRGPNPQPYNDTPATPKVPSLNPSFQTLNPKP